MKALCRFLTAALWTLCLGMTALADLLPPEPNPEPGNRGPLTAVFIIAIAVIAAAVLTVILRRRRR